MNGFRRTRIITVEHHSVLRDGLSALLGGQPDIELLRAASTPEEAMKHFYETDPDVALIDADMPDGGGLELIRRIRREQPKARIIALVSYEWDEGALAAVEAGACAFLAKDQIAQRLLPLIRGDD
jgi:two-component system, NarL family, response regulator